MTTHPSLAIDLDLLAPFSGTRCVVTGGLGFIGSNLALTLDAAGAQVDVIDALVPEHGGDVRNLGDNRQINVVLGSIADERITLESVQQADFVFNLAGQVSHLESMTDPLRDLELNVRSHLSFLETLRHHRPGAVVVHASTRQVYGRPRYLPVDEEHPTAPVDINGIDKLAGEQYHLLYARVHDMSISALRLTNVYGPRQNLSKDGLGFLPVFIRRVHAGQPITLYGDGEQLRDCMHVNDVVSAVLLAAIVPDARGQVFNLGHPSPMSLRAIAQAMVAQQPGSDITTVPWPSDLAPIDIGSFSGDYSKAKRILGWEPHVDFVDGIADTFAFYREHTWYQSPI
jgi:nucleoside-diphosphate-sugar epimerase